MPDPLRVLVVCTANICRSPATVTLLRRRLGATHDIVVTSAGVLALDGSAACDVATALVGDALARGSSMPAPAEVHAARRVTPALLDESDLVLALDRSHRARLAQLSPASRAKTFTLRQAARLAGAIRADLVRGALPAGAPPLPDTHTERLRWFVTELDANRAGVVESTADLVRDEPHRDDVPDPHVLGFQYHPLALALIGEAVEELGSAMAAVLEQPDTSNRIP